MFSEYASRFLAQSQSRITSRPHDESSRNPLDRRRYQESNTSRFGGSRYIPGRLGASNFAQLPFASRVTTQQAPLFHSAMDDWPDQEQEHEQEVADFYAQQRSRRNFMPSRPLEESSEIEDDGSKASGLHESGGNREVDDRGNGPRAIKSSWVGDRKAHGNQKSFPELGRVAEPSLRRTESDSSDREVMYEVGLESRHFDESSPPDDLAIEIPEDEDPPSVQRFKKPPRDPMSSLIHGDIESETLQAYPAPPESVSSTTPPDLDDPEPVRHDIFWAQLYLLCLTSLFATFLLVYLHTSTPKRRPLGDTIYSTIHASSHLLATDTTVAVIVSLLWLALIRNYMRPLVYITMVAVPTILAAFTLYPFFSSFQHSTGEDGRVQDTVMRWLSAFPGFMAILWLYGVYRRRRAFSKAIGILEFACKILAANPPLLIVGFGVLAGVVTWTWIWIGMFSRIFLNGHRSGKYFIIDAGAWWLGVFFVLVYIWTLQVVTGIQRSTTAATVSQWYFHRLKVPQPTSAQVVSASLSHAVTAMFGTICFSTLLTLLIRLPFLVMPGRLIACASMFSAWVLPDSLFSMTRTVTLTYASIHSEPLIPSAAAISNLLFLNSANRYSARNREVYMKSSSSQPYNLAVHILHATRLMTTFAFGFGAWVNTARKLQIDSAPTIRGSIYAYVVGLIAAAIGYGILGAMEGVLTGIVDAVVVCWASEMRNGEVRYCREAGYLLGDGAGRDGDEEEGLIGQ